MEHCVSAFLKMKKEEAYKIYMSDLGYNLLNGFYRAHGATEDVIQKRFYDIFHPTEEKPQETADEVIERMRAKAERMRA